MTKQKRQKLTFIILTIVIVVMMVLSAHYLLNFVRVSLEEDVKVNLMEIADKDSAIIAGEVNIALSQLSSIGELLLFTFSDPSDPKVSFFLRNQAIEHGFYQLMVSNTNGKAVTSSYETVDISKRGYFKTTLKGVSNISEQIVSKIDGEDVFVASVPIYKDGAIVCTLHRIYKSKTFADIFQLSLFDNNGYINVINDSGEVLVHTHSTEIQPINANYYRELYLLGNVAQADRIKSDLAQGKSGFVELKINGKSNFATYTQIKLMHGWNLVSTVPSSVVSQNANKVISIFLVLLSIILMVVVLGFAVFTFISQRNKKQLEVMAFVDKVTGGYTLNKLITCVPDLIRDNQSEDYAVIKLDIDNFKYINSLHGYEFGDYIIKSLYDKFSALLSPNEMLAHSSADTFIGLVQFEGKETLETRLKTVVEPLMDDLGISFSISCGVCQLEAVNENLQLLIDRAGIAAKAIKANSKKSVAIYSDRMDNIAKEEEEIRQTMEKALKHGEFVPYYQPKVNVYESKICGAEVLVRWIHPTKGLIPPFKFIPVLEQAGFIVDLDLYMYECVCQKLKSYIDKGIEPIPISVNFSRVHLYNNTFISRIKELIVQYGVPPKYIEIEITESAIFDNLETILSLTLELQEFGFILSMDDFGSGYSSLNMLKEIPMDVLKIDKDFFGGSSDNKRREIVIETIVDMAHKLDIKVIAEGVETIEHVNFLKSIDCKMAQGYYYSRPIPSDEFDVLFQSGRI